MFFRPDYRRVKKNSAMTAVFFAEKKFALRARIGYNSPFPFPLPPVPAFPFFPSPPVPFP